MNRKQLAMLASLTPRERQTLRHLLFGRPERVIAKMMRLKPDTIHIYIRGVYRKFRVKSRAKLMALFLRNVAKKI